jgi:hypothetical protein
LLLAVTTTSAAVTTTFGAWPEVTEFIGEFSVKTLIETDRFDLSITRRPLCRSRSRSIIICVGGIARDDVTGRAQRYLPAVIDLVNNDLNLITER